MLNSLAIACVLTATLNGVVQQPPPDRTAKVDALFTRWSAGGSPGCAVVATQNDRLLLARGYGLANLEHDVPITPQTVFNVASVGKQFTAASIGLLIARGRLSLDDDVRRFVPEISPNLPRVTIRHLLHHTSGLADYSNVLSLRGWPSDGVTTENDLLEVITHQRRLMFEPGEEFSYGDTDYSLLGVIVKRITGQSLREFAAEALFRPLGMANTVFRDDHGAILKNRATGYQARSGTLRVNEPDDDVPGDGSLFTSVSDLARWDPVRSDSQLGVVGVSSVLTTPGRLNDGTPLTYAGGLSEARYRGLTTTGMEGRSLGYRAYLVRIPQRGFGVSIACNVVTANPVTLGLRIADIYLDFPLPAEPASAAPPLPPSERADYAGLYWRDSTDEYRRIVSRDDALFLEPNDAPPVRLVPAGERGAFTAQADRRLIFIGATLAQRELEDIRGGRRERFRRLGDNRSAGNVDDYLGSYRSEELLDARWTIVAVGGQLQLRRFHVADVPLDPMVDNVFLVSGDVIRFARGTEGAVTGMSVTAGRLRGIRFEKTADPRR